MSTQERGVAVIGWACRLPGAPGMEDLFRQARAGASAFRPLARQRWDHRAIHHPSLRSRDHTPTTHAALVDAIELFAAPAFEISLMRAEHMDPQQRLLLEVTREALQDAGLDGRPYDREASATFVGISSAEYRDLVTIRTKAMLLAAGQYGQAPGGDLKALVDRTAHSCAYTLPGQLLSQAASNLAQALDHRGPSAAVDTACASGLTAVVQAVNHLRGLPPRRSRRDPAPVALAAAAHLVLAPDGPIGFSRLGALAVDRCRPYDAEASGFLAGEGVGAVLLKRLDDALQDGDRIAAVLRGVSWTNDGAGGSPVSPCPTGQRRVVELALKDAGVEPRSVAYVEGHGTATAVGDRQEVEILGRLWHGNGARAVLASAKGAQGHPLPASGMVGLLRAGLAVERGIRFPSAGWSSWPPGGEPAGGSLRVLTEAEPWVGGPRRALVCSFGFGGHNCAAVVEEPPRPAPRPSRRRAVWLAPSAGDPDLLRRHLRELLEAADDPAALAWTLALRPPGRYAALLRAATAEEAARALDEACTALESPPEEARALQAGWVGPTADLQGLLDGRHAGLLQADLAERARAFAPGERRRVSLPPVPARRQACWVTREPTPAPAPPFPEDEVLSPDTHPFLDHHRPGGRAVLPLAAALDRMAWAARLEPPFALERVRVHRLPLCRESMRLAVEREGPALRLVHRLGEGRRPTLVSACVSHGFATLPPAPALSPGPAVGPAEVARFYREGAFHGEKLQALEEVRSAGPLCMTATVRTCPPRDWWPGDPRERWSLDPMLLDGSFQLGLFLAWTVAGRGLLPTFADEVAVLKPLDEPRYEVHFLVSRRTEQDVVAEVRIESGRGAAAWIRGLRARFASPSLFGQGR